MYFQLEADYYSNKANKNKYKNFQLKASIKKKAEIAENQIAENQIVQGIVLATRIFHICLDLKVLCCLDLLLLEGIIFKCKSCFFEHSISRSIFISI